MLADRFGRKPLGIVRVFARGTGRRVGQICYDERYKNAIENVILVDSEMKTGKSLKLVKDEVRKKFNLEEEQVKVAILVLCNINIDPSKREYSIEDLKSIKSDLEVDIKPDFIAYVSQGVRKRIHEIR